MSKASQRKDAARQQGFIHGSRSIRKRTDVGRMQASYNWGYEQGRLYRKEQARHKSIVQRIIDFFTRR